MKDESQGVDPPFCSYQRELHMRVCDCRLLKENHIPVTARDASNDPMERGSSGCFGSNIYTNLHERYPERRSSQDDNLKKQLAETEKGFGSFCHDFRAGKFIEGSGCTYDRFGDIYDGNDYFPRREQLQVRNSSDKKDKMLQDSFIQLRAGGTMVSASTSNTHASVANLGNQAALSNDASAICYPGKGYSTNRPPHRRPLDPRLKVALSQKGTQNYTLSKMDNSAPPFKHVIPASSKTETSLMNAPNLISSVQSVKLSDISSLLAKMLEASTQSMHLQCLLNPDSLAASHPFPGLVDKGQKMFLEHGGKGKEVVKSPNCQGDSGHEEKQDKNPRAKKFKVSLAEMVVELLKPAWQEGHMSREEHKSLAKRIVDKVMRALQGTSFPTNEKHIEQYLALSKPRIAKLVEEYVEYQKACKS